MKQKSIYRGPYVRFARAGTYISAAVFGALILITSLFFVVYQKVLITYSQQPEIATIEPRITTFPVSVDVNRKRIEEDPKLVTFLEIYNIVPAESSAHHVSLFKRVFTTLAQLDWYQNLASVSERVVVVYPGDRKEQVAHKFAKILKWDTAEREHFFAYMASTSPGLSEGNFYPGEYVVPRTADARMVAETITARFGEEILNRYDAGVAARVSLSDALIIASLLEREAYDFSDMRVISGVIWNRLFADMRLQLDATLQYAKGSSSNQPWWPQVVPADKYIASPYNTYKHLGLPPGPIANPSFEAVLAALNPEKTDCMFYFHDAESQFHCTPTYTEHVALLKKYYGQGK